VSEFEPHCTRSLDGLKARTTGTTNRERGEDGSLFVLIPYDTAEMSMNIGWTVNRHGVVGRLGGYPWAGGSAEGVGLNTIKALESVFQLPPIRCSVGASERCRVVIRPACCG